MDIKIDAVFSLVDGGDESKTDEESQSNNEPNKETWEVEKHQMVIKQEKIDPGYDNATNWEDDCWKRIPDDAPDLMDWSTEDDIKPFQDGADSPPSLLIENNQPVLRSMLHDSRRELLSPPVLLPQIDILDRKHETEPDQDQTTARARRKCMKIHPCYIVLSKLDSYLKGVDKISNRSFRREYRECPNICKQKHFRRRLNAGHDVFNVKIPSKTKGYREYLELSRLSKVLRKSEKKRSSPKFENRYKDLIQRYANSTNAGGAGRIMRSIQSMPKDFRKDEKFLKEAMLKKSVKMMMKSPDFQKNILEARSQVIVETEREIEFKRELSKLKRQIDFQRSSRKAAKKYQLSGNVPGYFKSGTSSVSGRVRKTNTKYGDDFLKSRDEFMYHQSLQTINQKWKRENKKAEEAEKLEKGKKLEREMKSTFQFVIDNPEKELEVKDTKLNQNVSMMELGGKVTKYSMSSREERDKTNAKRRELHKRRKTDLPKTFQNTDSRKKKKKKRLDSDKDGVIIKDIPTGALADMLLSEDMGNTYDKEDTESAESDGDIDVGNNNFSGADQFSHAKSILKKSANNASVTKAAFIKDNKSVTQTNNLPYSIECTMDPDRAKALRIPEKVRLLFTKDKRQNETTSSSAIQDLSTETSSKVIKKVIGTPVAIQSSSGESQKFIITPDGLVKRVEHVKGFMTPQQVEPTSTIGIANPLLTNTVLNAQPGKVTQGISVSSDPCSQLVKIKVEPPSDGYPDSKVSNHQQNPDKPRTVPIIVSGRNKPQQNVNIQLVGDGTHTNKNLYYQFYMGGKKYLVPAAPGIGQQNAMQHPPINANELKETNKITSTVRVDETNQIKQNTLTLGRVESTVNPTIASNAIKIVVPNEQRMPVTTTESTNSNVSQHVKVHKQLIDNIGTVDKTKNLTVVTPGTKVKSPLTTFPVCTYSNGVPDKQVSSVRPIAIPIRLTNLAPKQDNMNSSKVVGGTQAGLSPNEQGFTTLASQTLIKMCNSPNFSLVDPNTKQIKTMTKPINTVANQAPKTAVVTSVPNTATVKPGSMNTLMEPRSLNTLVNQIPAVSALSPSQTSTMLSNQSPSSLFNHTANVSAVSLPPMPTAVNPTQFSQPLNPSAGTSSATPIAAVVNRAVVPYGVRFLLIPSTSPGNAGTLNVVSTPPPVNSLNTASNLSSVFTSPSQTLSSVTSTGLLVKSPSLNKQIENSTASDAVRIPSQTNAKLKSVPSQSSSQTQLRESAVKQDLGLVQSCVDPKPEVIIVPISKPSENRKVEEKSVPFAEAVSAREERLKKLKETLKEKQVALEKLRQQRLNKDSDSEEKLI